jgi:hypothetical protein
MPDPRAIRNALIAKLWADPALMAEVPHGVYYQVPPPGSTRFVIVSQMDATITRAFDGRVFDERLFLVEARILKGSGGNIGTAGARIDALLDPPDQPATLVVPGYTALARMELDAPLDNTEQEEGVDPEVLWFRAGGQYLVTMTM